jgi:hypothetical protein
MLCHKKCLCDILFNANKTYLKLLLRSALVACESMNVGHLVPLHFVDWQCNVVLRHRVFVAGHVEP